MMCNQCHDARKLHRNKDLPIVWIVIQDGRRIQWLETRELAARTVKILERHWPKSVFEVVEERRDDALL
jgi:hypothetical protein